MAGGCRAGAFNLIWVLRFLLRISPIIHDRFRNEHDRAGCHPTVRSLHLDRVRQDSLTPLGFFECQTINFLIEVIPIMTLDPLKADWSAICQRDQRLPKIPVHHGFLV